jgi:hypothetical protein
MTDNNDKQTGIEDIVYDTDQREYYYKNKDLFLEDDDIKFYKLRPYSHITVTLPHPLPENYFREWDENPLEKPLSDVMKEAFPDEPNPPFNDPAHND